MARLAFVTVCIVLFAVMAVSAVDVEMEDEAPVPEGFSLPNIFNPVLDRADGRDQAKTLVNLVAKEPKVAFGVGGPEKPVEDMWNGESDPESSASVAQLKMLREVDSLTKLIDQGKKILKVLPRKEKRLALLKQKLSTILDAKAKREAAEKLDEQQALLDAIKKREGAMSKRLNALKSSQSKLTKSVGQLQKVIAGPKKAKALPKVGANKSSVKETVSAKGAKRESLMEMDSEAGAEAEVDAELDQELQFEAAEAYDQE
jgi:hypothetical protein